jgi:hypothetical protein
VTQIWHLFYLDVLKRLFRKTSFVRAVVAQLVQMWK